MLLGAPIGHEVSITALSEFKHLTERCMLSILMIRISFCVIVLAYTLHFYTRYVERRVTTMICYLNMTLLFIIVCLSY